MFNPCHLLQKFLRLTQAASSGKTAFWAHCKGDGPHPPPALRYLGKMLEAFWGFPFHKGHRTMRGGGGVLRATSID